MLPDGRPKRSLGQNFLVDAAIVRRIVDAAGIEDGDTVLEIGPGRGALTPHLRKRSGRLLCIEKDDALAADLGARYADDAGFCLVHADAMQVMPADLPFPGPYKLVANLPYNLAARITMHVLDDWGGAATLLTLMYQDEVASRITAAPSTEDYGALSVLVQDRAEAWKLFTVPGRAFRPVPRVVSAVVRLRLRREALHRSAGLDSDHFRRVVRGGFGARRKTIANSLRQAGGLSNDPRVIGSALEAAAIDPGLRPDAIAVDAWIRLAAALPKLPAPAGQ